jgi:hypothetical protein
MADIFDDPQGNATIISDTATDADSPDSALTRTKERQLIELLLTSVHGNFREGTLTANPTDTTGYCVDTAASFTDDQHNGRRIIFTDGNAKGHDYLIDDTDAANNRVACTGDDIYSAGARSGDGYIITGNFRDTGGGHDHDDQNSRVANYRDGFMQIPGIEFHNLAGGYTEHGTNPGTGYSNFMSTNLYMPQNATTIRCRIGFAVDQSVTCNVRLVLTKIDETDGTNDTATNSNVVQATSTTFVVGNCDIDCSALATGLYHLQLQVQTPSTSSALWRQYFYNTYWIN